jgi:hypothetical protein
MSFNPDTGIYMLIAAGMERGGYASDRTFVIVSDGSEIIAEHKLNNVLLYEGYTVECCDESGRFLAAWSEVSGPDSALKGQFFSSDGEPDGGIFDIRTDAALQSVMPDPVSGKFLVAYKTADSLEVAVVSGEGDIGEPAVIAEFPSGYYDDYQAGNLALVYDASAEAVLAVWSEMAYADFNLKFYGRHFRPDGAVSPGEPLTLAEIDDPVYGLVYKIWLYGGGDGKIRMIWWDWYRLNALNIVGGEPAAAVQSIEWEGWYTGFFDPVYDPDSESIWVIWTGYPDGSLGEIRMRNLNEMFLDAGQPVSVGEIPVEDFYGKIELTAAYNPVHGAVSIFAVSNVFFGVTLDYSFFHTSSSEMDLADLLRNLDGEPDNPVNIADVVKFLNMFPFLDRNKIDDLLELIEPVYPVLVSY